MSLFFNEPTTSLEHHIIELSKESRINDFFLSEGGTVSFKLDGEVTYSGVEVDHDQLYQLASKCNAVGKEHGADCILAGDFGLSLLNFRYRANFMKTMGRWRFVLRLLPSDIPEPIKVGIPEHIISKFMALKDGLVLLCGPTGSGKSTTIASLMYYRARRKREHVLTLEDPLEYLFPDNTASLISQREVGQDVPDFASGLKTALRQSPNLIMVGEIRDHLTAEAALQLSETGHVVVSTLHTTSADMTVQRFMKLIPAERVTAAQSTLAEVLQIVMCQRLLPVLEGKGRTAVHEIMVHTSGIASMIRNGNFTTIRQEMDTGSKYGHLTWSKSVDMKIREGIIDASWADEYDTTGAIEQDFRDSVCDSDSTPPLDRKFAE